MKLLQLSADLPLSGNKDRDVRDNSRISDEKGTSWDK
jgi:hypothetical protein